VPYEPTRDFFFSGHTGTLSIIMIELFTLNYKWVTAAALLSLIYMMNMLTITRVHYTVDIAGGLIFAFFAHKMVAKIVFYGDWLLSAPYLAVKKFRERGEQKVGGEKKVRGGEATDATLEERLVEDRN
jgi:formate/nitrite transporter FocA (FNT family)